MLEIGPSMSPKLATLTYAIACPNVAGLVLHVNRSPELSLPLSTANVLPVALVPAASFGARAHAPAAASYTPLSTEVVPGLAAEPFFTSTRCPATSATPSTVISHPAARSMAAVEATTTSSPKFSPRDTMLSVHTFVATSASSTGGDTSRMRPSAWICGVPCFTRLAVVPSHIVIALSTAEPGAMFVLITVPPADTGPGTHSFATESYLSTSSLLGASSLTFDSALIERSE